MNRAYCIALGDTSQLSWDDAPEWQKASARNGVVCALAGNTPEQLHDAWADQKIREGWTYGLVKDPATKQHPCLLPYNALATTQRAKDGLFIAVVRATYAALQH